MKTFWKILVGALIIVAVIAVYNYFTPNSEEIKSTKSQKESLKKGIDSISKIQTELVEKAKDSAKSYTEKGNNTIKVIYYEKKPIVLPAADSVRRYIADYKFVERK